MKIELTSVENIIPHRQAILRPGQDESTVLYDFDKDSLTGHFSLIIDDKITGIVSLLPDSHPDSDQANWRIRGMGVYEEFRGKGFGKKLLQACIQYTKSHKGSGIWCNARSHTLPFYNSLGFKAFGEEFNIPGAGLIIRCCLN